MKHYSVLKEEAIEGLNIKENGTYVDMTLGYAGDSSEILKRIKGGQLIAFDKDQDAINYSKEVLSKISRHYQLFHTDYSNLIKELANINITRIDGILFDLGVSSPQLDENRGFTFMRDEQLDMRMNKSQKLDAKTIVNTYSYDQLKNIFYSYGEEKKSPYIAKAIINSRENKKINTTQELVEIIKKGVGANYFYKTHPERNIFQAIRIEVNNELESLKIALHDAIKLLAPKGRIVVITFHSLEDKIVKNIFKEYSSIDPLVKGLPNIPNEYLPTLKIITKKAIIPSQKELAENKRSASAKLRIAEKI